MEITNSSRAMILAVLDGAIAEHGNDMGHYHPVTLQELFMIVSDWSHVRLKPDGADSWPYPLADENTPEDRGVWYQVMEWEAETGVKKWRHCRWGELQEVSRLGFPAYQDNPYERSRPPGVSDSAESPPTPPPGRWGW